MALRDCSIVTDIRRSPAQASPIASVRCPKSVLGANLLTFRRHQTIAQGWRDLPFWWPVIVVPQDAVTSVFAAEATQDDTSAPPPAMTRC